MSGIERDRIVGKDQDELDELTCGICHDIFDEPVFTECCRQTYCTLCINQWLVDNNTCPNDRQTLDIKGLLPSARVVTNLLKKLKIKCPNYYNGCEVVTTIEKMRHHEHNCDKSCSSCKNLKGTLKTRETTIETLQGKVKKLESDLDRSNKFKELEVKALKTTLKKAETDLETVNKKFEDFILASQSQERSMEQVIFDAKRLVNNYNVEGSNLERSDLQSLIANSQNAIHLSGDFNDLVKRIGDKMNDYRDGDWTVTARCNAVPAFNWGLYVIYSKFAKINFDNLITITGYQNDVE